MYRKRSDIKTREGNLITGSFNLCEAESLPALARFSYTIFNSLSTHLQHQVRHSYYHSSSQLTDTVYLKRLALATDRAIDHSHCHLHFRCRSHFHAYHR